MKANHLRFLVVLLMLSGLFSSCRENVIPPPEVEPPTPPPAPQPIPPHEPSPLSEAIRLLEGEDPPDLIYLPYETFAPDTIPFSFPVYDEDNEAEGIVAFRNCPPRIKTHGYRSFNFREEKRICLRIPFRNY